jgi:hypothetical protein
LTASTTVLVRTVLLRVAVLMLVSGSSLLTTPTAEATTTAAERGTYVYDALASSTTPATQQRAVAPIGRSSPRTSAGSSTFLSVRVRATKGADEAVNLASSSRTRHILQGDGTGGGHLWPGRAGKTPFPREWDADRVMHEISDIATDPAATVVGRQGRRTVLEGTRGAVRIRVVTDGRDIITGYPTNLPRNPR